MSFKLKVMIYNTKNKCRGWLFSLNKLAFGKVEEPIQVRENQEIAGIASLYKYLLILYETLECI